MEDNLILEGLLSMVTELKERQEKQVTPASREETINRLDVIEQRISDMQGKSGIPENTVQEILNQIGNIRKGQSENQKQDLEDIKGLIVTSHRYFRERLKVLFPADDTPTGEATPVSWYGKLTYRVTPYLKPNFFSSFSRDYYLYHFANPECPFYGTDAAVTGQRYKIPLYPDERKDRRQQP